MKKLPIALIWSRLAMGAGCLAAALLQLRGYRAIIIVLIVAGLISDILDGIIARRLGVSNEAMRRLDSGIDQIFWIMVLISTCIVSPAFYKDHMVSLALVVGCEALAYMLSWVRFRKEVATHAILSKIWTLTICVTIIDAIATGHATWSFDLCFYLGMFTRIEIILILLTLRQWTNDVPSLYHAVQLRRGREIKRSRWFNG